MGLVRHTTSNKRYRLDLYSYTHAHTHTHSIISSVLVEDHALKLSGLCLWLWASAASMNHICFSYASLSLSLSFSISPQFPTLLSFVFHAQEMEGEETGENGISLATLPGATLESSLTIKIRTQGQSDDNKKCVRFQLNKYSSKPRQGKKKGHSEKMNYSATPSPIPIKAAVTSIRCV